MRAGSFCFDFETKRHDRPSTEYWNQTVPIQCRSRFDGAAESEPSLQNGTLAMSRQIFHLSILNISLLHKTIQIVPSNFRIYSTFWTVPYQVKQLSYETRRIFHQRHVLIHKSILYKHRALWDFHMSKVPFCMRPWARAWDNYWVCVADFRFWHLLFLRLIGLPHI